MAHYRSSRRRSTPRKSGGNPYVAFLLVACFGILFAGCSAEETADIPQADEFSFTADDLARIKELVTIGNGSGATEVPHIDVPDVSDTLPIDEEIPVVNMADVEKYNAIRGIEDNEDAQIFRVTNPFLNVRSEPRVTASQIERLEQGDSVEVIEFVDAAWAKVQVGGQEGYVAARYISRLVSEDELSEARKKYEGLYFVDFGFLNVRKEPDANSEKIGELPGQSFVRPLSMDEVWARIPFENGDGYVAVQYLTPFIPNFLVRQSTFTLPVIHYRLDNEGVLDVMPQHIAALKNAGYTLWTVSDFADLLVRQEERDVRLNPNTALLVVSGVTDDTLKEVSDILRASAVQATLFLQTQYLGNGISQQDILTQLANGNDLQSGGHTGDDLRSLTNAQVELELVQSKKLLEDMTKRSVIALAYPLGGVNDRVAELATKSGYLMGIGAEQEIQFHRSQLLRMPSIVITASTTSDGLLSQIREE